MSRAEKTGCVASLGDYHGIDYSCEAESFRWDEDYNDIPPDNCSYAVKSKSSDYCKFIWKLPNGEPGFDGACHCAEAKLQALDVLYRETMRTILSARYNLVAGLMRRKNR